MSSGSFVITRYQASYGAGTAIHPIKVQPETTGLQFGTDINTPPAGVPSSPISARVSGSKRSIGLNSRKISFRFTGANPVGGLYKTGSILVLPWFNPFSSTLARGASGTYLGETVELVGLIPESVS